MEEFDVIIIGAGVTGASIARRLSAYSLEVALLEKETDVSFGVSKANSGIIHGGFHHRREYLKSHLEVQGNIMFDQLKRELHFPFERCGILVAAFSNEEMRTVQRLYDNGTANGVIGIEMCNGDRMRMLEPKLNEDVLGGLFAPGGGIVEPYRLVFSLVESATLNGVRLFTDFKVTGAEEAKNSYLVKSEDGRTIRGTWVVNAAGLFADTVSSIFKAEEFTITPRKGEEFLLDRNASAFTSRVIFPVPSSVSKGMLVIPTVEGTTMVGPTADSVLDKEDTATSRENFGKVFYSARRLVPSVSERDIITSFAGLRPVLEGDDFYIELSKKKARFVQVAGIQSPGLTASPAIAEYVKDILKKGGLKLMEDPRYQAEIPEVPRLRNLDLEGIDAALEKDPAYGEIVCRCENISEAEVVAAIERGHTTLDGIKFYTRAGMGRCQGGFCSYKILKIIARETGMSLDEISKRGAMSWIIRDRIGGAKV